MKPAGGRAGSSGVPAKAPATDPDPGELRGGVSLHPRSVRCRLVSRRQLPLGAPRSSAPRTSTGCLPPQETESLRSELKEPPLPGDLAAAAPLLTQPPRATPSLGPRVGPGSQSGPPQAGSAQAHVYLSSASSTATPSIQARLGTWSPRRGGGPRTKERGAWGPRWKGWKVRRAPVRS